MKGKQTQRIKVSVTPEHIKDGKRTEPSCCPIALALRDKFPRRKVCVMTVHARAGASLFRLPKPATDFIYLFDAGGQVKPFAFYAEYAALSR